MPDGSLVEADLVSRGHLLAPAIRVQQKDFHQVDVGPTEDEEKPAACI
jgi:hypothetical protein